MKVKFENLEDGEVKMTVSLDKEEFEKHRQAGFKKVQEFIQIDGFRKGNVPENVIVEKYGEMVILEEMAHLAINDTFYSSIIKENEDKKDDEKIIPLSEPKISITKIGQGSDLEYNAVFSVLPKIDLVDYKKIAKEENEKIEKEEFAELKKKNDQAVKEDILEVTEGEVVEVLESLRKTRSGGGHVHEDGSVHSHSHEHVEEVPLEEGVEKIEKEELPELNDEFAQSFGDQFKTLDELKAKVKENLVLEKKSRLQEKKRTSILERLVTETKTVLPEALIEDELERMKLQTKADIERFGSKWEEYLTHLKKTEEDLKSEWRDMARKRVMSQLLINEIAKKEKVEASKEDIDAEALKIMTQMPEANENNVRGYVQQILINEKVMRMLDGEEK
ncbi:Trigger factor [bioreactor metagenome]|uniref:peptidylprolyl isomerase n=1 Tax=bioreactor metagenome TaxID=1076179 RepID=A0A644UA94_9ZZZZ|nr:trigger factor [Candidatus Elulimicrobiales bacterium]